jgi:hypothetical protein
MEADTTEKGLNLIQAFFSCFVLLVLLFPTAGDSINCSTIRQKKTRVNRVFLN